MREVFDVEELLDLLGLTEDERVSDNVVEEKVVTREINLAGTSKKDIQVSVVPNRIVIGVENGVHSTIEIETGIDPEEVKASYKNGLLTVKYPSHPEPFKVEIK